jgi:hypothetical protein
VVGTCIETGHDRHSLFVRLYKRAAHALRHAFKVETELICRVDLPQRVALTDERFYLASEYINTVSHRSTRFGQLDSVTTREAVDEAS